MYEENTETKVHSRINMSVLEVTTKKNIQCILTTKLQGNSMPLGERKSLFSHKRIKNTHFSRTVKAVTNKRPSGQLDYLYNTLFAILFGPMLYTLEN